MKKVLFLLIVFILSACSQNVQQGQTEISGQNETLQYVIGSNDWSVVTSRTSDPLILEAFQYTLENPDPLAHIPCYCGCYELDGHTSVRDCFVDSVKGNIAILDNMGFG